LHTDGTAPGETFGSYISDDGCLNGSLRNHDAKRKKDLLLLETDFLKYGEIWSKGV
jgi:hypothetical protein